MQFRASANEALGDVLHTDHRTQHEFLYIKERRIVMIVQSLKGMWKLRPEFLDMTARRAAEVLQRPEGEFRFGGNPAAFGALASDVNGTVSFGANQKLRAVVGDFANCFKWGYAANIPLEIIQFGDPDGQGDLKRTNEVVLRSEAYIGWGILDANSFALIKVNP